MLGMDAGADLEVEAILRGELSPACERRFRVAVYTRVGTR
jgi:hypothetical protein